MNWKYRALHLTLAMLLVGAHSAQAQNYVLPVTMVPPAAQKRPVAPAAPAEIFIKPTPVVAPIIKPVVVQQAARSEPSLQQQPKPATQLKPAVVPAKTQPTPMLPQAMAVDNTPFPEAPKQSYDKIASIGVEGVKRVDPATVISYLTVRPGDEFDPLLINDSLKALFATGYFADISLFREGNKLVVAVKENPIVNEIAFEGNDKLKTEQLQAETQLRTRTVYTRARVQEDMQRLLQVYRRAGFYAATIDPKIIELDQNRVNLVFEITEGVKTKVSSIKFVGNETFDDSALRSVIQTKEARWFRFLTSDDNYDQDRVAFDEELLRKFYLSKGYVDFKVTSSNAELSPEQQDFFMTYTIDEGKRYKIGKVDVKSGIRNLNAKTLNDDIKNTPEGWYNADQVEATVLAMTQRLGNMQYGFAEVKPNISIDRSKREVNLVYNISEGPRVFVERVNIVGNVRTLDEVIRRQMLLVEGDPFNQAKLKKSEQNLRDLGFFQDVKVETKKGSRPDQAQIDIKVAEQSTGELSLGAGFSTADGPLANVGLRERNFLGKGQDLSFSTTFAGRAKQYDISFTEPAFLDRNLSAGFDIYQVTRDFKRESSYDFKRKGAALRLGYPLAENWGQKLHYRFEDSEVQNVDPLASLYIKEQEGSRTTSEIGHEVAYDTRDSKLDPTTGYVFSFGNDLAGLGGDAKFVGNKVKGQALWPLTDNASWVLSTSAEAAYIIGLGQDVFITDRYFIGADKFRGFDRAGIGPRDALTGDALGGNRYAKGTVEVSMPIGLPKELGVKGHAFTDFGTLGQVDIADQTNVQDDNSLRMSVGYGLSWKSPMGPLRADFAIPIMKEEYDEKRIFNFSFGTSF